MSAQQCIRLGLAVVASLASFALSWPFWRDFGYWAESHTMWTIYFVVGFCLAVFVFVVFQRSLSTLFDHAALGHHEAEDEHAASGAGRAGGEP
jgi:hypothetical protein